MEQNYRHYKKYYPPHHFVFLSVMGFCIAVGVVNAFRHPAHSLAWSLFAVLSFCILYLAIMLRQHYALGNQDRIVRLEFQLRYFELMGKPSGPVEKTLSFSQVAALRFADDSEFIALLHRLQKENLDAEEIKKSIRHWQADDMRV